MCKYKRTCGTFKNLYPSHMCTVYAHRHTICTHTFLSSNSPFSLSLVVCDGARESLPLDRVDSLVTCSRMLSWDEKNKSKGCHSNNYIGQSHAAIPVAENMLLLMCALVSEAQDSDCHDNKVFRHVLWLPTVHYFTFQMLPHAINT